MTNLENMMRLADEASYLRKALVCMEIDPLTRVELEEMYELAYVKLLFIYGQDGMSYQDCLDAFANNVWPKYMNDINRA